MSKKLIYPNLFIPGAAKSGTTSLHQLLEQHPDINMSSIKEPVFWNTDTIEIDERIDWYNNLFDNPQAKILGESTTSYMYYSNFISNIKQYYTAFEPKFIFILRNPIDRLYSHYWWMVGRGQESLSLEDAIQKDTTRDFEAYGYVPDYYYHFGLYSKWLQEFFSNFKKEHIKIITTEALKHNPLQTLNACFEFLELKPLNEIKEITANQTEKLHFPKMHHFIKKTATGKYGFTKVAKYLLPKKTRTQIKGNLRNKTYFSKSIPFDYPKISSEQRQLIFNLYQDDVRQLKTMTNLSFSEWKDFE